MIAPERSSAAAQPSFAAVFDEYAPFVLRVMRHLGVPPSDLQDQSQEVFMAVFRGLPEFGGRSSLQTWLYGICLRVASNHRRRAHVRRERPVAELPEQSSAPRAARTPSERAAHPGAARHARRGQT